MTISASFNRVMDSWIFMNLHNKVLNVNQFQVQNKFPVIMKFFGFKIYYN